jgi:hypothetical protein
LEPATRGVEVAWIWTALYRLGGRGYITPDEADMLRELSKARSDVAHGRLDLMPIREQVEGLSPITREMLPAAGGGTDH